ncbi:SMI1/KNR4 family protein [Nocardia sp. alder85J]|uniref:SMI1/KNR4 family protein n=1 Tax=Nocardia sp. alder85J TaxID=2862949 RepID=UPI001CD3524A|nr:SMI1/KNR4 family protein [Nocardia sp. alder85J]MCX4094698.1 SMI1/KNR4 family protein [Nocardia sp. alder85J]
MPDTPTWTPPQTPEEWRPEEWRPYLLEYGEIYVRTANEYVRPYLTAEQVETHWFGAAPADEHTIAATEQRLGLTLPPSLSTFLRATDGWRAVGGWIDEIYGCADLAWLRDTEMGAELIEIYSEDEQEDDDDPNEYLVLFRRALRIAAGEDLWLLDPTLTHPDGEYTLFQFYPKYGDAREYSSFAELVHDSRDTMIKLAETGE